VHLSKLLKYSRELDEGEVLKVLRHRLSSQDDLMFNEDEVLTGPTGVIYGYKKKNHPAWPDGFFIEIIISSCSSLCVLWF